MNILFIGLFLVLPFSNFLFTKLDMWHAQGFFFQVGLLVAYSLHIFKKNKPLGSLLLWSGLLTSYYWLIILEQGKGYAVQVFLPFFNFLCMVICYDLIVKYPTKENLQKLLTYLTIPVSLVLIYALLQRLQLDQFYSGLAHGPDKLVGTIGNPMHLGHYLCICLPCFLMLSGEWRKIGILAILGIIILTQSMTSLCIAVIVLIFCSCFKRIFKLREILLIGVLLVLFYALQYNTINDAIKNFTFSQGRFEFWSKLFPVFKQKPITGWGLGIMNALAQQKEFLGWRHVHNEFFHFSVELGLIGFSIIIWGVIDYFKTFWKIKGESLSVILAGMFLAFTLTSLFGYPAHLWISSGMAILAYAGMYLLKESYDSNLKGN